MHYLEAQKNAVLSKLLRSYVERVALSPLIQSRVKINLDLHLSAMKA